MSVVKPQQLFAFCAVVEEGGFSRAAKVLYMTQPAVSMSIRELERAFGQPLLDRRTDPITPTPLGQEVYRLAREMRDRFEALKRLEAIARQPDHDHLVIAYGAMAEVYLLTSELVSFQATYPQYHLAIQYVGPDRVAEALASQHADFGLWVDPPDDPHLVALMEWEDALWVVVPRQVGRREVAADTPLILPPEGPYVTRRIINRVFQEIYGRPPRSFMEISHPEGLKQAVLATGQPGILLERSMREELENGDLVRLKVPGFPYRCRHVLCYRRPLRKSPGCLALVRYFRSQRRTKVSAPA